MEKELLIYDSEQPQILNLSVAKALESAKELLGLELVITADGYRRMKLRKGEIGENLFTISAVTYHHKLDKTNTVSISDSNTLAETLRVLRALSRMMEYAQLYGDIKKNK